MIKRLIITITALFMPAVTAGVGTQILNALPDIAKIILFITILTALTSYIAIKMEDLK